MGPVSFATPIFLGALAAISVPIIIHLIYRLRRRQVLFSTLIGSQLYEGDYRAMIVTGVIGAAVVGGFCWYQRKYSIV